MGTNMKYGDLIQFEQIESVIQLLDAGRPDEAKKLVATYVISDDMAERISKLMVPQLGFGDSVDHKGVLIVGNYGTGKSHLMSVLSLVAEDAAYAPMIRHPKVAEAVSSIAGKFKVLRIEVGGLEMPLRQVITQQLERFLDKLGVSYSFPAADQELNNKESLEEMMAAFHEVYPDQGLLLVVDEFLEYLQSRKDNELIRDLAILRQIGEITKHLKFRFVAGVQEAIFDSVRFQHVADSMRRVNERFTQILIDRQDVSFVVSARLLKKTADQQNKIREYLTPFAKFYGSMNERMDEYVRLFPVHPDYLKTFEQIHFTEKRGALKTIEAAMLAILDQEVPADKPLFISYESFWNTIKANSVLRADPNIKEVMRVSEVLESRVQQAFTRPAYKAMALRVINALAVHRLTTGGDIHVPIGPTAAELRDALCLFQPGVEDMPGDPAENLLSMVQTVLREVLKTVNGQFISKAPDTEQYYLDLKKDIDYDAQIEKRAEALSDDALDRAYYSAIKALMECSDDLRYPGFQIWQYQIEWQERRVERMGYLFFGAPNDRPTAQPERDFYIYFIQPFDKPKFSDNNLADEVFFRLKSPDEDYKRYLSQYAAALDLASTASGGAKAIYLSKAQDSLRSMSKWLQEKQMTAFEVTYQGKTKTLQDWSKGVSLRDRARLGPDERINFRDVVNIVSGLALGQRFADISPEYPTFSVLVTEANRKQLVGNALRALAGGTRTKDAAAILDALELLDGDRVDPASSRYAQEVLNRLKAKGHGQVLNRSELLSGTSDVEYFAPIKYRLEPDLLVTVLGGLVYSGDIVLSITGDKIDSGKLAQLAERSLEELKQFKHVEAPKEINLAVLRALFELFDLPSGLAQKASQGDTEPVIKLQEKVSALVPRVLKAGSDLQQGKLGFWGQNLLREEEAKDWHARLDSLKKFTESLAPYNTVGKLKNLRVTQEDLDGQKKNLEILAAVERLLELVVELGSTASYLSQAEMVLPAEHPWVKQAETARKDIFEKISQDRTAEHAALILGNGRQTLNQLKKDYITAYIASHSKARLGVAEDKTRNALRKDDRLLALRVLAGVSLMPTSQLTAFEESLNGLKSCSSLDEPTLVTAAVCPHCQFRPSAEQLELIPAANRLHKLDDDLDQLVANWQQTLLENLEDPFTQDSLGLLPPASKKLIDAFLASRKLPEPMTSEFANAVQEALSGLEKIAVKGDEIKQALLQGGSPATPDDLRKRFDTFMNERCKGKDATKLRFVIE
ncbi:ATP-binding protein [Pseudomonas aeruginosa]|nr:ATP-binding protein [Pseudomonas aeruginosa]MBM2640531.1 ATP-binding protein [Pseudomonas aeruginosa]MBM2648238.1 ATP-binding protein [Pseudomonas aeruginosa]MBM2687624.1 ATP-binding protein [Pseudomonas aeruginosa]MBM2692830.1 ATP-binding protein [Pseudomonas aeruginosa]